MEIKPLLSVLSRPQAQLQADLVGELCAFRDWRYQGLRAGSQKGCHGEIAVTAFPFSCAVKIKVEKGYTITDI